MYYKDDFYKEFRTEKELCEYLEEIDSRAEWIRITSKKLKVAAAGEETCTEVPGISLEALEKDTLSHSRLVLILPERICYIGNSAIKSLKGRARIDGKALADVDKKTLAEILNKCLKVARGRALIRFCEATRSLQVPFTASMQMKSARNLSKKCRQQMQKGNPK